MGGRGAGSGGGGNAKPVIVTNVVTQSGDTADLSAFPLTYGKPDPALSATARTAVQSFESSHVNRKTEYGLLLDANGNQVYTAHGGSGSVSMPRSAYGKSSIMTHNHPRGKGEEGTLGGTFSEADLAVFANARITTMRAAAAEGTYSITKGPNFDDMGFSSFIHKVAGSRSRIYNKKVNGLVSDYKAGSITYNEYFQKATSEFNHMLVGMHNDLLSGRSQYGYTYTLER